MLPAQHATGNWIKVVQRLQVRITLDAEQLKVYPLQIGLSTTVTLRENNTNGPALSTTQRQKPAYQSQALVLDTASIDGEIQDIIKTNAITIPMTGRLAQRFGERKLFLASVALFALASLCCGFSNNLDMLIFFRIIQGLVAG